MKKEGKSMLGALKERCVQNVKERGAQPWFQLGLTVSKLESSS